MTKWIDVSVGCDMEGDYCLYIQRDEKYLTKDQMDVLAPALGDFLNSDEGQKLLALLPAGPVMNTEAERIAAVHALDALYAKYGCQAIGMWGFEGKATAADLDEAYRLRAIVWSTTEDSCGECFSPEEHSRNIECTECGATRNECKCREVSQ